MLGHTSWDWLIAVSTTQADSHDWVWRFCDDGAVVRASAPRVNRG